MYSALLWAWELANRIFCISMSRSALGETSYWDNGFHSNKIDCLFAYSNVKDVWSFTLSSAARVCVVVFKHRDTFIFTSLKHVTCQLNGMTNLHMSTADCE
jgi:hypothetical protein